MIREIEPPKPPTRMGQVVRLLSGGPAMTVTRVIEPEDDKPRLVIVVWCGQEGQPYSWKLAADTFFVVPGYP